MDEMSKIRWGFFISVIIAVSSAFIAFGFQTDFGTIDVQEVAITDINGYKVVGKLYRPVEVDSTNPAPGIIGLHGYNNDKDVMRPYAIELARAGMVVLTIDQTAHGDSEGMLDWYLQGSNASYNWLQEQPYVNGDKMGIYGHSMGYLVGNTLATINPDHDACGFISFPALPHNFTEVNNVLHLWAEYEEFFRDDQNQEEMFAQGQAIMDLNSGETGTEFDTNYGNFLEGTAYREHLATVTHPGLSADPGCVAEMTSWMMQALLGSSRAYGELTASTQTFVWLELFGLIALMATFIGMIFLFYWLLKSKFFAEVKQPLPKREQPTTKTQWWIFASINAVIGGVAYIFFTHADEDWMFQDPFKMGIMNNYVGFYTIVVAIAAAFVALWFYMAKRKDKDSISIDDLGITYPSEGKKWNWRIFGKTILLALILFDFMYLMVWWSQDLLLIEFRGFWTFMKTFTPERFWMFMLYLPLVLAFYLVNGGILLFGELKLKEERTPQKTQIVWWVKSVFTMVTGLLIVFLIQYLGYSFGYGPTFNVDSTNMFNFAPMMPIQLMGLIPMSILTYYLMVMFYRNTGKIYLGSLMGAIITTWFWAVGTVVGAGL